MKQIFIVAIVLVSMIPISVRAQETELDCSKFTGSLKVRCERGLLDPAEQANITGVQEQSNGTDGMDGNATMSEYADSQNQTQTLEWSTYNDPILGVSIKYPEGWVTSEEPNVLNLQGGQTIPLDNGTEVLLTCFIWVGPSQDESSKESMQDYLNSRRGEIELISTNGSLVIDGIPAYKAYYNNSNSDPTVDYDVVDSANSMKYSLSCRSDQKVFNQYAPIFEEMAKSLNIL